MTYLSDLKPQRFSKQKMLERLEHYILVAQKEHGFTTKDGWNQVKGKGEELNREYGEFSAYLRLHTAIKGNWL